MEYLKTYIYFVKHLKTYENYSKRLEFNDLNSDVKMDIISNIFDNNEYLSNNWNIWTFREYVEGFIGLPKFEIIYRDVDELYEQFKEMNWEISESNVRRLMNILKDGDGLDPVMTDGGYFFDGGHRLTAYKMFGKDKIPTIDIAEFKNINWEEWLEA